jgi:hypothetical protein
MPEVTPPDSEVSALPAPAGTTAQTAGDDPLGHLYKMSTTAGLGSQEYVAINTLAVLGVILGVASILAVMANVLLILPLAGFIFSAIAFIQIQRSNGTQTGKGLAVMGIVLSMGFIGFVGTRWATEDSRTSADRQAIARLINSLGQAVRDKKFEEAYALFTPRFQARINQQQFTQRFSPISENQLYGKLKSIETNGLANFESDPSTGGRFASATMIFHFDKISNVSAQIATFHETSGQWRFEDIPEYFPSGNAQ